MMANEQHAAIDDGGSVRNNDSIRSSANIMTEKLYLTVMDVYETYADTIKNKENDEYNKMVANLNKKRLHMPPTSPVNKTDDTRGVITKRILEGWTLHTGTCNKCAMPLMEHNGDVSCVLCQRIDDGSASAESKSNINTAVLSLASTSASDSDVDDKENLVDKKLSQFRDQRSKANEVYTAKILGGYIMHDELCKECDMPMMKCNDLVECVFCQNEDEEEKDEQVDMLVTIEDEKEVACDDIVEAPEPLKELSQAEIIAKRCRDMKSKSDGDVEAEAELLNMIGTLDMSGDINETIQAYFLKKKADRAEEKKRNELSAIVEAQDDHMAARAEEDNPPPLPADSPKFDPSISCNNLGDTVFNALKKLFASATVPVDVENMCSRTHESNPKDTETKLVNLNKDGWMVSAESCSQCKHLMFTNVNVKGLKRCVMCEPLKMQQSKR